MKVLWKLYFAVFAALSIGGWLGTITHPDRTDVITFLNAFPDAAMLIGLFGYAFSRRWGTPLLWRALAAIAVLSVLFGAAVLIYRNAIGALPSSPGIMVIALLLILALVGPSVVALLKYANWLVLTSVVPPNASVSAGQAPQRRSGFGQRPSVRS